MATCAADGSVRNEFWKTRHSSLDPAIIVLRSRSRSEWRRSAGKENGTFLKLFDGFEELQFGRRSTRYRHVTRNSSNRISSEPRQSFSKTVVLSHTPGGSASGAATINLRLGRCAPPRLRAVNCGLLSAKVRLLESLPGTPARGSRARHRRLCRLREYSRVCANKQLIA